MTQLRRLFVTAVLLGSAATPALAQSNLGWLHNMPAEKFSKADVKLLSDAMHQALENTADDTPVTWASPDADNGGVITPSKDPAGRASCRKTRIENHHKAMQNTSNIVFCKVDGKWKWDRKGT